MTMTSSRVMDAFELTLDKMSCELQTRPADRGNRMRSNGRRVQGQQREGTSKPRQHSQRAGVGNNSRSRGPHHRRGPCELQICMKAAETVEAVKQITLEPEQAAPRRVALNAQSFRFPPASCMEPCHSRFGIAPASQAPRRVAFSAGSFRFPPASCMEPCHRRFGIASGSEAPPVAAKAADAPAPAQEEADDAPLIISCANSFVSGLIGFVVEDHEDEESHEVYVDSDCEMEDDDDLNVLPLEPTMTKVSLVNGSSVEFQAEFDDVISVESDDEDEDFETNYYLSLAHKFARGALDKGLTRELDRMEQEDEAMKKQQKKQDEELEKNVYLSMAQQFTRGAYEKGLTRELERMKQEDELLEREQKKQEDKAPVRLPMDFRKSASCATWLCQRPVGFSMLERMKQEKLATVSEQANQAPVPESVAPNTPQPFKLRPSVGTWLMPSRKVNLPAPAQMSPAAAVAEATCAAAAGPFAACPPELWSKLHARFAVGQATCAAAAGPFAACPPELWSKLHARFAVGQATSAAAAGPFAACPPELWSKLHARFAVGQATAESSKRVKRRIIGAVVRVPAITPIEIAKADRVHVTPLALSPMASPSSMSSLSYSPSSSPLAASPLSLGAVRTHVASTLRGGSPAGSISRHRRAQEKVAIASYQMDLDDSDNDPTEPPSPNKAPRRKSSLTNAYEALGVEMHSLDGEPSLGQWAPPSGAMTCTAFSKASRTKSNSMSRAATAMSLDIGSNFENLGRSPNSQTRPSSDQKHRSASMTLIHRVPPSKTKQAPGLLPLLESKLGGAGSVGFSKNMVKPTRNWGTSSSPLL